MPRFFFHLISADIREVDEVGSEFSTAYDAEIEAWHAAAEMTLDSIRSNRRPTATSFEVSNMAGELVFSLEFSELLGVRNVRPKIAANTLELNVQHTLERSRRLKMELAQAIASVQRTVQVTRTRLALSD
jgi:hypothetical protein